MSAGNIPRILGKLGAQRGRANEARVLEACVLSTRPAWMRAARIATPEEDHDGIDVVVESDVGKLFVQVKSSRRAKADFLERRRRARIAVVVVGPGDSPEGVLRKVVGALASIRADYLRQRAGGHE